MIITTWKLQLVLAFCATSFDNWIGKQINQLNYSCYYHCDVLFFMFWLVRDGPQRMQTQHICFFQNVSRAFLHINQSISNCLRYFKLNGVLNYVGAHLLISLSTEIPPLLRKFCTIQIYDFSCNRIVIIVICCNFVISDMIS